MFVTRQTDRRSTTVSYATVILGVRRRRQFYLKNGDLLDLIPSEYDKKFEIKQEDRFMCVADVP